MILSRRRSARRNQGKSEDGMPVGMNAARVAAMCALAALAGCGGLDGARPELPTAQQRPGEVQPPGPDYLVGPSDSLTVHVWRNPDLTITVPVRPDGRISVPLIDDLQAAGKTPTALSRDIEKLLARYIQDPVVTVIVTNFHGPFSEQVRVVGEATRPQALAFRERMTLLDVMIQVGGLTPFAAGNRGVLVRAAGSGETQYRVRIADLVKDGDTSANVAVLPGDVVIIPQSWF
jgi:polysaccharide export outer membrane protein